MVKERILWQDLMARYGIMAHPVETLREASGCWEESLWLK